MNCMCICLVTLIVYHDCTAFCKLNNVSHAPSSSTGPDGLANTRFLERLGVFDCLGLSGIVVVMSAESLRETLDSLLGRPGLDNSVMLEKGLSAECVFRHVPWAQIF